MATTNAYVGIGANLGDPIQQILDACKQLSTSNGIWTIERSGLYITSPVGYDEQSDFVNCVCMLKTTLSASDLLFLLQSIELNLGRQRDNTNQNSARVIDLDILLFGNQLINTEELIVPHPRLMERLFALIPLDELEKKFGFIELSFVSSAIKAGNANASFIGQTVSRLT